MSREEANGIARAAERMRRSRLMRAPLKVVVPTAAALGAGAAVGAVAVGAIPGSDKVIHACYLSSNPQGAQFSYGALRVIDPSLSGQDVPTDEYACNQNETAISWNQQGPPGPVGPTGKPGPAGASGQAGAAGADGSATIVGNTNFGITATPHVDVFLKLDGIKGESADDKHKGEIDIESFAFGSEAPVVGSGSQSTGAGAGKVTVSTFSITKKIDKSSPILQRDLATGKVIKSGEVDVVHTTNKGELQVASYKVTDLALKSISIKGEGQTVDGSFKAMQITLGSGQNQVSVKWNKVQNTGSWNIVKNQAN